VDSAIYIERDFIKMISLEWCFVRPSNVVRGFILYSEVFVIVADV
jgi:hypothetical protein